VILVLHPWGLVRAAIPVILGLEVLEARSLDQAQAWTAHKPRLAIVEPLWFPESVQVLAPLVPVVVLTASTDPVLVRRVLEQGASAFVHVTEDPEHLRESVEDVLAGAPRLSLAQANGLLETLSLARQGLLESPSVLTPRELEILELLATGLTNSEIAEHLVVTTRTVQNTVYRLYKALGVRNRTEAAIRALRAGLV